MWLERYDHMPTDAIRFQHTCIHTYIIHHNVKPRLAAHQ
jgi:hypothetical protein